jgi:hypothetical protein
MVLDAKVGVKRESKSRSRRAHVIASSDSDEAASVTERAAFRINLKDLRFLKSLGIDPTRKVRTRKAPARKAAK